MSFSNPWFAAAVIGMLGWFHIKLVAEWLNLSRMGAPLPAMFKDLLSDEDRTRSMEYHVASAKHSVFQDATSLGLTLAFWFLGGFGWLDGFVSSFSYGSIGSGLLLLSLLSLISTLLSLPFDAWNTFKIEAAFGFNKTTVTTFVLDRLKSLLLMAVLGLPIAAMLIWFFESTRWAAFWAWLATTFFGLLMTWLSPRFLMPLFLKFTPLEDGPLRQAIMTLAQKLAFPVAGIFTVDGSRRSTKANAFFAGFGKNRRIALFDTLIGAHTQEEIVAVLAHEIGHAKLRHVPKQIIAGLAQTAVMFALLHLALTDQRLFSAFEVANTSVAMGFALFMMIYGPWSHLIDPLISGLSRKHEFEADAFARSSMETAEPMVSALKKLSIDHLAHLTPHPFYVWLHYSHPPVVERIQALESSR